MATFFVISPYPAEINEALQTAWHCQPVETRSKAWTSALKRLVLSGYAEVSESFNDAKVRAAQIASTQGRTITVSTLVAGVDLDRVAIAEPQTGDDEQLKIVF